MYPHTQKSFTINDQTFEMYQVTLGLQYKLEDENISVSSLQMIEECTDITKEFYSFIPDESLQTICEDIIEFSSYKSPNRGKPKAAMSLIAWLMNRGHIEAQHYRVDFVRAIINEYVDEAKGNK